VCNSRRKRPVTKRCAGRDQLEEAFAGQKGRFPWQGLALQLVWQCLLEFFDPLKADGDLGVDDRIYQRCPTVERIRKLRLRPVTPAGVLGEKVEQHV
jgi:hypothetical protein